MRETLLIIDGRGQPEQLIRTLEKAGFFCVYARGPLKAKALLKEHPVALVVWKDNTGNADLSRDLARVWKTHSQVPVIHLFARELHSPGTDLGPQVRGSLPVDVADVQLLPLIEETLGATKARAPSELDVRGAAGSKFAGGATSSNASKGATPPFSSTAVSQDERSTLYADTTGKAGLRWLSPWRRLWQRLLRTRAQPGSTPI
jgi:hypothetical protein